MNASAIDHDGLFKALLRAFFYEFLALFFPKLAACIDPASIEFLEKEIQIHLPGGRVHRADLVAKAKLKGLDVYFLVHAEHQSTAPREFPRRFYEYFCGLFLKHGLTVYPIAIYSHVEPRKPQPAEFTMSFQDREILKFSYEVVQLNRLSWRDFMKSDNPIASALMAKMNIVERDRPRVKLECLRMMAKLRVDPAHMRIIQVFVDSYLRLNREETKRFERSMAEADIDPQEKEQIMEMTTSWKEEGIKKGFKQGRKKGREEGRDEGRVEGQRRMLLNLMRARFGLIPGSVEKRVEAIRSAAELDALFTRSLTAASLEDLGLTLAC